MADKGGPSGKISHTKAAAKVMACICDHEYQDEKYGKRRRLHNPNAKGYVCTVCGNQKNIG